MKAGKYKAVYFSGCVMLFLGLLWMFLPHALHGKALSSVSLKIINSDEELEKESDWHHITDILFGMIIVFMAIIILLYSNKYLKNNYIKSSERRDIFLMQI